MSWSDSYSYSSGSCYEEENNYEEEDQTELEEKAVGFLNRNDFKNAFYFLNKVLQLDPHSIWHQTLKAECFLHLGNYRAAHSLANKGLYSNVSRSTAILIRSISHHCLNGFENCDNAVILALNHAPHNSVAKKLYQDFLLSSDIVKKGDAAFNSGKFDEAFKLYGEAMSLNTNSLFKANMLFKRANACYKIQKFQSVKLSIQNCTDALKITPNDVKIFLLRANCFSFIQQYDRAIHDYRKAYDLDQKDETHNLLLAAQNAVKKQNRARKF